MNVPSALKARVYDKKEKLFIMDAIRFAFTDELKGEKMLRAYEESDTSRFVWQFSPGANAEGVTVYEGDYLLVGSTLTLLQYNEESLHWSEKLVRATMNYLAPGFTLRNQDLLQVKVVGNVFETKPDSIELGEGL